MLEKLYEVIEDTVDSWTEGVSEGEENDQILEQNSSKYKNTDAK